MLRPASVSVRSGCWRPRRLAGLFLFLAAGAAASIASESSPRIESISWADASNRPFCVVQIPSVGVTLCCACFRWISALRWLFADLPNHQKTFGSGDLEPVEDIRRARPCCGDLMRHSATSAPTAGETPVNFEGLEKVLMPKLFMVLAVEWEMARSEFKRDDAEGVRPTLALRALGAPLFRRCVWRGGELVSNSGRGSFRVFRDTEVTDTPSAF